jgi:hypothetical protein
VKGIGEMKKIGTYQQNFSKGEFDPQLWGSSNLEGYYEGLAEAKNVWVTATGSIEKRYGLRDLQIFNGVNAIKPLPFMNTSRARLLLVAIPGKIIIFNTFPLEKLQELPLEQLTESMVPLLCGASYLDSVILTAEGLPPQQLK